VLRGKGLGLEVVLAGRDFDDALNELGERLSERPDFYRGTSATAVFDVEPLSPEQTERLRSVLDIGGITLSGITQAENDGELARRRAMRPRRAVQLSDSARSLVADFAGARADIAQRRKHGQTSVPRLEHRPAQVVANAAVSSQMPDVPAAKPITGTLYHVGTLRGGQSLQQVGNIVVVGDVNPGAELIATGDVLVFGALRGVAHAGAQGDVRARVYALELAATQLRIATTIGADLGKRTVQPEVALVRDGRIAIVPANRIEEALSSMESAPDVSGKIRRHVAKRKDRIG